ncbi:Nucleotidyltransferase, putative [Thermococcus sp. 4557]|nr:Nucleotidyltransferase, putative [Thermococcus sp. 4557]
MRDYRLYVEDILEAISRIEEYTEELSLEEFRAKGMVIDAVVRNLEIIGEACRATQKKSGRGIQR